MLPAMRLGRGAWLATLPVVVALSACGVSGPSRLTVENRTMEDVVILTGHESAPQLFIAACGQAIWELGAAAPPVPTVPPDATAHEIAYEFRMLPDAPTIQTFTITSERIWTGAFPSPPPCAGDAPDEPLAEERMPAPATIRLTTDPREPSIAVPVVLVDGDDATIVRSHTFLAGVSAIGSMPTSSGRYVLRALGDACAITITVGPEHEADVELRVTDERTCELSQIGDHGYGAVTHAEPGVLIAPGSVP